uniref:Deltamethrin resistance protein prag01 domain-containing protein n=1 Tax=Panagrolaimus sp. ES5 TaxID=591445 RepID=A0AC34FF49_9BILA
MTTTTPKNESANITNKSKKEQVATAGTGKWLKLTEKDTWTADENGWVGPYANRNRALIYVFGNCVILAAFFVTLFALLYGGCLFKQNLNDLQQTDMPEFYDPPPQLSRF